MIGVSGTPTINRNQFIMPNALRQFKATIFQALAHPTRIAILELLRDQDLAVSVILERLGLEPANASQHFAVLRAKHIITSRKQGSQVFYSVRDPLIIEVLDIMRKYFQVHLQESVALLNETEIIGYEEAIPIDAGKNTRGMSG
jgi:DNA-binding transcriptional ArsR family regulator